MKTLREYIDQLDEISRRDALKYAGATAAGAALGVAGVDALQNRPNSYDEKYLNPKVWTVLGYLRPMAKVVLDDTDKSDYQVMSTEAEIISSKFGKKQDFYKHLQQGADEFFREVNIVRQKAGLDTRYSTWIGIPELESWAKKQAEMAMAKLNRYIDSQLEETAEEDPIAKIDRLFRDK